VQCQSSRCVSRCSATLVRRGQELKIPLPVFKLIDEGVGKDMSVDWVGI